jgi:hypothetical protein
MTDELTDYQIGKLIHTFGLDYSKKPYRNYYQCPCDNDEWEDMIRKGFATKRIYSPSEVVYFGTLKGLRKVFRKNATENYFKKIND